MTIGSQTWTHCID